MVAESGNIHTTTMPAELDGNNLDQAFKNFLNPFTVSEESHDCLFCLSSGKPATTRVAEDLLQYSDLRNQAAEIFIKQQLCDWSVKFHDKMKKVNLQTFQSLMVLNPLTTSQKNVVQVRAEYNLISQLLMFAKEDIDYKSMNVVQERAEYNLISQLLMFAKEDIDYKSKECSSGKS